MLRPPLSIIDRWGPLVIFVYNPKKGHNKYMTNTQRISTYPILPQILNRHSSRQLSGVDLTKEELLSLFEAARWAPSANNNQLWHYAYARKNTSHWDSYFELLDKGNQEWCAEADVLVILLSRKKAFYKNKAQPSHSLEAGMSLQNLATQATTMNIIAHPMAGFDYNKARIVLKLNENWKVECMIAIGKTTQKNHEDITDRKRLEEIITEGIPNLK